MSDEHSLRVRVARKQLEAEGICSFELVEWQGRPLPSFAAGAHIDVQISSEWTRQYSLFNAPGETQRYCIAVQREPGARSASRALYERVGVGDLLEISPPQQQFALTQRASSSVLLAGGIGIAPLYAMAQQLSAAGAVFQLHYFARRRSRAAFVAQLSAAAFGTCVSYHFDDEATSPSAPLFESTGLAAPQAPEAQLYVCGPRGFVDTALAEAAAHAWSAEQLHCQYFAREAARDTDEAFEVELARSGRVLQVAAAQPITEALRAHGVWVPTSCEAGVCGACLTRVLAGLPDHRDAFLGHAERQRNDQMLVCCSRSRTPRLVLDL